MNILFLYIIVHYCGVWTIYVCLLEHVHTLLIKPEHQIVLNFLKLEAVKWL